MTGSAPSRSDDSFSLPAGVSGLLATAARTWARADRGWQAVAVAGAVTIAVQLGVSIPW